MFTSYAETNVEGDEVSHPHPHPHEHEHAPPQQRPSAQAVIERLNARLTEKANEIRQIEDREVFWQALADDRGNELAALRAVADQVTVENRTLRRRLGIPELGALELTEEEAGSIPPEVIETQE